jgi:hypothetical protein
MGGMLAPMLEAGTDATTFAVEREDYVGHEDVQLDENGRPVMAVVTAHGDGRESRLVFAPTARALTD